MSQSVERLARSPPFANRMCRTPPADGVLHSKPVRLDRVRPAERVVDRRSGDVDGPGSLRERPRFHLARLQRFGPLPGVPDELDRPQAELLAVDRGDSTDVVERDRADEHGVADDELAVLHVLRLSVLDQGFRKPGRIAVRDIEQCSNLRIIELEQIHFLFLLSPAELAVRSIVPRYGVLRL